MHDEVRDETEAATMSETRDRWTGFTVRNDLCTGCHMCVLACVAIKRDGFSFDDDLAHIDILRDVGGHGSFSVEFNETCDGCSYCIAFCGYGAIEKPEGWRPSERLLALRDKE